MRLEVQNSIQAEICDLGLINYKDALTIQRQCVNELIGGGLQKLLLCEHPKVLTFGRLAKKSHMLFSEREIQKRGYSIEYIDRGGEVTLHCPGQLVVYPILNLADHGKDLHKYMTMLEKAIIMMLKGFAIEGRRSHGQTGVWVERRKIASIGIGVKKWISYHGLAINVNTDLDSFSVIKPCGLDVEMTSIKNENNHLIDIGFVKEKICHSLGQTFQLDLVKGGYHG